MTEHKTKPTHHHHDGRKSWFDRFSSAVTRATGSPYAFGVALGIVVVWAVSGPLFKFSDSWQLVINTGTTIITFLMVFVIQQSQNKDTMAIQLKLNELIACDAAANNRLVDIEDLSPEELAVLKQFYVKLAELAENDDDVHTSHSLDEADDRHQVKLGGSGGARGPRKRAKAADKSEAKAEIKSEAKPGPKP